MKQELDVLRKRMLRDLIQAPKSTIDFNVIVERVEGEIWSEDGKDWILENGFIKYQNSKCSNSLMNRKFFLKKIIIQI